MSETAIFTHETDPFTMNPVALLKLSKEAYYLYGYIKSKPSGWLFHKERTLKDVSLSKYGFYKALRDLEAAGYMTRTQVRKMENSVLLYINYTVQQPIKRLLFVVLTESRFLDHGKMTLLNILTLNYIKKKLKIKKKRHFVTTLATPTGFQLKRKLLWI